MEVLHDEKEQKFYIPLSNGEEAVLAYKKQGTTLNFTHTFVPPDTRHKGLAEQIVEAGFRYAQKQGFKVIPSCPYVSHAFLRKRPEFLPLVQNN